jgi:hypothetical protein
MSGGLGKDSGLNQGVEPRLGQVQHFGHFHDRNNCLSGLFLDGHWAILVLFQDGCDANKGRLQAMKRTVLGLL